MTGALLGPGLVARRVRIAREEVAWLRFVLEAHEGLANLHGDGSEYVTLITPACSAAELDAVLAELGFAPAP